jgi:hypothetical protein
LTTDERILRGERARMLMQDPLLSEVMDSIEKRYIEELLRVSPWRPFSDAKRRALIDRVNAVRELRSALESEMALGRQAAGVKTYRVA